MPPPVMDVVVRPNGPPARPARRRRPGQQHFRRRHHLLRADWRRRRGRTVAPRVVRPRQRAAAAAAARVHRGRPHGRAVRGGRPRHEPRDGRRRRRGWPVGGLRGDRAPANDGSRPVRLLSPRHAGASRGQQAGRTARRATAGRPRRRRDRGLGRLAPRPRPGPHSVRPRSPVADRGVHQPHPPVERGRCQSRRATALVRAAIADSRLAEFFDARDLQVATRTGHGRCGRPPEERAPGAAHGPVLLPCVVPGGGADGQARGDAPRPRRPRQR